MNITLKSQTNIFNKLLAKTLKETKDDTFDNICLITNETLLPDHIKLNCGHTFNYNSIFKEVVQQKYKSFLYLETQRLKNNQIKCPYCRYIQKGILPYRENMEKIKYVNWPEKLAFKQYKCKYIYLSGKKKGLECGNPCSHKTYCKHHLNIIEKRKQKQKQKDMELKNTSCTLLTNISSDSYFIKCLFELNQWKEKNSMPTIHRTKTNTYFRHKCQHIINKGKKNEKTCKNYVKCSKVINNNSKQSISPVFYKQYFCGKHDKMTKEETENNVIYFPKEVKIDLNNIPECYLINEQTFNLFLSKYYTNYFNSQCLYKYNKFSGYEKIIMNDHDNNEIIYTNNNSNIFLI